jgi:tRNA1Val (adenine37-N6)-methyltransferase
MANTWFRFRQFIIHQEKTAMKVGTDSVLLGSWCDPQGCSRILDVGTGTGILALMLAQRSEAIIDAIDSDPQAAEQAAGNFALSPWKDRLKAEHLDFAGLLAQNRQKYELVVCNPPYFRDSLRPPSPGRSMARHTDTLQAGELIKGTASLLSENGHFCLVFPAEDEDRMREISAANRLFPSRILRVRPVPSKNFSRVLMELSFREEVAAESELVIENGGRHRYSPEYLELTKEYYPERE